MSALCNLLFDQFDVGFVDGQGIVVLDVLSLFVQSVEVAAMCGLLFHQSIHVNLQLLLGAELAFLAILAIDVLVHLQHVVYQQDRSLPGQHTDVLQPVHPGIEHHYQPGLRHDIIGHQLRQHIHHVRTSMRILIMDALQQRHYELIAVFYFVLRVALQHLPDDVGHDIGYGIPQQVRLAVVQLDEALQVVVEV